MEGGITSVAFKLIKDANSNQWHDALRNFKLVIQDGIFDTSK